VQQTFITAEMDKTSKQLCIVKKTRAEDSFRAMDLYETLDKLASVMLADYRLGTNTKWKGASEEGGSYMMITPFLASELAHTASFSTKLVFRRSPPLKRYLLAEQCAKSAIALKIPDHHAGRYSTLTLPIFPMLPSFPL